MAANTQIWVTLATLKTKARATVESLNLTASTAASGTYQSPAKSRLLKAIDALPKEGLTKASHLLTLADFFETERTRDSTAAVGGSFEVGDRNLRRAAGRLLKRPDSFVKKTTAEAVLALFADRTYP